MVVSLGRDKDQRLTLRRLAEVGINMKSLEGSIAKTNKGSLVYHQHGTEAIKN